LIKNNEKILYDTIEYYFLQFLKQIGWNTNFNFNLEIKEKLGHLIEAYIHLESWIINCTIEANFSELFNQLQDKYEIFKLYENVDYNLENKANDKKNGHLFKYNEILYDYLSGIAYHEFGHSKECPIDSDNFANIFQAVSTCLEKKKKFNKELNYYIINLFSDLVINTVYGLEKENSFFRNSVFTHFFSEIVLFNSSDTIFNLFVLLNLKVFLFNIKFRDKIEDMVIKTLPKNFEKVIKDIIRMFCKDEDIIEKFWLGIEPSEDNKWKIINTISDNENWDSMAYRFTEIISDYISEDIFNYDKISHDCIFTKKMRDNESFRKEILNRIVKNKLDKREEIKNKTNQKYKLDENKNDGEQSQNNYEMYPGELSLNNGFEDFERNKKLDAIYNYRLKKVKLNIEETKKSNNYPLIWLNRSQLREDSNISNFDPLYTYFLPNSDELILYEKKIPFTQSQVYSDEDKGFPDLAIFCDDSGSMDWKIETGDGKYDKLIITLLSLIEWLKNKEFASVIEYNFTFFSNTTRSTDWIDYFHLDEMKELLFTHEGGQTKLNPTILENILRSKHDKLIIIISDGIIFNYKEVYKKIRDNAEKGKFLFIQIGTESKLVQNLKKERFYVKIIEDISNLSIIMLDFLKNSYNIT